MPVAIKVNFFLFEHLSIVSFFLNVVFAVVCFSSSIMFFKLFFKLNCNSLLENKMLGVMINKNKMLGAMINKNKILGAMVNNPSSLRQDWKTRSLSSI